MSAAKLATTNWNLLSIAQKILSKKNLLENFQWYKKQHEKEIAAWRLGCSTILMLLEILWVFDKYLPQPCFPEWHENREIIQRDVRNIFPSTKNNFIIFIIIITIGNSLSFYKYLSQPCFLKKEITQKQEIIQSCQMYIFPKTQNTILSNWTFSFQLFIDNVYC